MVSHCFANIVHAITRLARACRQPMKRISSSPWQLPADMASRSQEQVFHCEGCGAEFILPPNQISSSCVYCGSPHVVNLEKTKELLAPDGIIPHAFNQKRAIKLLIEWVEGNEIKPEKQVELPRGSIFRCGRSIWAGRLITPTKSLNRKMKRSADAVKHMSHVFRSISRHGQ